MSLATLSGELLARKGDAAPAGGRSHPHESSPATGLRPVAAPKAASNGSRVRLSLRLDSERHRRLRVAAACQNQSMQAVMLAALDRHLADAAGGCSCIADELTPVTRAESGARPRHG